jgi:acylphosphatase
MSAEGKERRVTQIVIRGRVQGVSFRAWTQGEAVRLGLDGWVRNRADGGVEVIIAGPADAVDAIIETLRQGPPLAVVTDLIAIEAAETPGAGFHIRA